MMRIGICGDTHIRDIKEKLPSEIGKVFKGVDLILHTGDIFIPSVLNELEQCAPVFAAAGDDDSGTILTDDRVKLRHVLYLEGNTLLLIHGTEYYHSYKSPQADDLKRLDDSTDLNIVVFGHTHYSIMEYHRNTLFLNPGSPYAGNYSALGTVATLNISSGNLQASIVRLKDT